jgi:hypothetical protein
MHWSLRVDIVEGQTLIVFVNDLRGNLFVGDLEENVVGEHGRPLGLAEDSR